MAILLTDFILLIAEYEESDRVRYLKMSFFFPQMHALGQGYTRVAVLRRFSNYKYRCIPFQTKEAPQMEYYVYK